MLVLLSLRERGHLPPGEPFRGSPPARGPFSGVTSCPGNLFGGHLPSGDPLWGHLPPRDPFRASPSTRGPFLGVTFRTRTLFGVTSHPGTLSGVTFHSGPSHSGPHPPGDPFWESPPNPKILSGCHPLIQGPFLGVTSHSKTLFGGHPSPRDPLWGSPPARGLGAVAAPVELAELDLDLVEVGALQDVLGPAVLHQLPQLLQVAADVGRGPEARPLPALDALDDLCGDRDPSGRAHQQVQEPTSGSRNPLASPVTRWRV